MRREPILGLSWLILVLFGSVFAASPDALGAGDAELEAVLKQKGLTKAHSTWVLAEAEAPVLAAMKEAHAVFNSFAQVAERQAEAEQLVAQSKMLDLQRAELQANLTALNQQIAQMPNPAAGMRSRYSRYYQPTPANNPLMAQRVEMNNAMTELNRTQQAVKSQIPSAKAKAGIDDEVKRRQEAFKTTLVDLRKQIDEVTKKYADLEAEDTVKKSIEELKVSTKARIRLGPSDPFLAAMKDVDKAEQRFLGKTAPPSSTTSKKKAARAKK